MSRAAIYIDGFNLYHAIDDLGEPHLKWCNYRAVAEKIVASDEIIEVVKVATAFHPDFSKKVRHQRLLDALQNVNVTTLRGHYVKEEMSCKSCSQTWMKPTEKESDINIAISIIDDAHRDKFDVAYLVTKDTDQAATARLFKERFLDKRIISVSPPNRSHSQDITRHCHGTAKITRKMIECSLLPSLVLGAKPGVKRPYEYDPPAGWTAPAWP